MSMAMLPPPTSITTSAVNSAAFCDRHRGSVPPVNARRILCEVVRHTRHRWAARPRPQGVCSVSLQAQPVRHPPIRNSAAIETGTPGAGRARSFAYTADRPSLRAFTASLQSSRKSGTTNTVEALGDRLLERVLHIATSARRRALKLSVLQQWQRPGVANTISPSAGTIPLSDRQRLRSSAGKPRLSTAKARWGFSKRRRSQTEHGCSITAAS